MKVAIFGAGISGLAVAHELLDKGYDVVIYECDKVPGGMAKSSRQYNGMPTEHSWRGYAPFYENFMEMSKRIPFGHNTVYDNLSIPIKFIGPNDDIKKPPVVTDYMIVSYYILKYLLAGKSRRLKYAHLNILDKLSPKLSEQYMKIMVNMLGPGLGLNVTKAPISAIGKVVEMALTNHDHSHADLETTHKGYQQWHVMKRPTSEAFINPWVKHLINKRLQIKYDHTLVKLNVDNIVTSAIVKHGSKHINVKADYFVVCIDPFSFNNIIKHSGLSSYPELNKFSGLTQDGPDKQISFRIAFSESINLPEPTSVLVFPDSEFNLTLYPQDRLFSKDVYLGKGIKGLWSGTACLGTRNGQLFNLPAYKLTKQQFIQEVIFQIYRSTELNKIIFKHNNKNLSDFKIIATEVWHEWYETPNGLTQSKPKWVNTDKTKQYRPSQKTTIGNLYLAGAHTDVSVDIWSMEGAVESGKLVSRLICQKDNKNELPVVYTHKPLWYTKPIRMIDQLLYNIGFPSIVDIFIALIILIVMLRLIAYYSN